MILCAGQEPLFDLEAPLIDAGINVHRIGGATEAIGLDAERAIREGIKLAARL